MQSHAANESWAVCRHRERWTIFICQNALLFMCGPKPKHMCVWSIAWVVQLFFLLTFVRSLSLSSSSFFLLFFRAFASFYRYHFTNRLHFARKYSSHPTFGAPFYVQNFYPENRKVPHIMRIHKADTQTSWARSQFIWAGKKIAVNKMFNGNMKSKEKKGTLHLVFSFNFRASVALACSCLLKLYRHLWHSFVFRSLHARIFGFNFPYISSDEILIAIKRCKSMYQRICCAEKRSCSNNRQTNPIIKLNMR